MAYTALDIINKLIEIEKQGYKMYNEISQKENIPSQIKTIARVFALEEKRHIKVYADMKEINKDNATPIDFDLYDRASQLINRSIMPVLDNFKDANEILEFALEFEHQNLALVMSVQGILVRDPNDKNTGSYEILTQLIEEEKKHIEDIKSFLK